MKYFSLFFTLLLVSSLLCRGQTFKKYYEGGLAKMKAKDYVAAIVLFSKAIELRKDNPVVYYYRGLMKQIRKDTTAIKDFDKAISLKPDYAEAYFFRAAARVRDKKYMEALPDFDKAIRYKPDYAEAFSLKGNAQFILKDSVNAIINLNKALALDSSLSDAYFMRGLVKFQNKEYVNAIYDFDKANNLEPDYSPDLYYFRGASKLILEQKELGCLDLQKALKMGYTDASTMIKQFCQ